MSLTELTSGTATSRILSEEKHVNLVNLTREEMLLLLEVNVVETLISSLSCASNKKSTCIKLEKTQTVSEKLCLVNVSTSYDQKSAHFYHLLTFSIS